MEYLEVPFGWSLNKIKELVLWEYGTLEGVYLSTFNDHYKGNNIGQIFELSKEYPYDFNWYLGENDRGVYKAYIIKGDINRILSHRKVLTDELKKFPQDKIDAISIKPIFKIDRRWKKEKINTIKENNEKFFSEKNKIIADYMEQREIKSKELENSVFGKVSSRQYFLFN